MPNGSDAHRRTDRGLPVGARGEPSFSEDQRIWLLERDLDETDRQFDRFRNEVREQFEEIKTMVSRRLWWLTGIGFSLLISVLGVLVAVVASQQ